MFRNLFYPKLFECLPGYSFETFRKDALAGLAVGIVAVPLGIAFAIASGVSPEKGLITAAVAGFITSLLGGSRVAIGGPTGAFVVIILGILQQYGLSNLLICTIMAGAMLLAMGIFRVGGFIHFIPYPLISGFTSGIAVLILSTQIKDFLGMPAGETESGFIALISSIFSNFSQISWVTVAMSVSCLVILLAWPKKIGKYLPASLAVLVIATLATKIFGLPLETIGQRFENFHGGMPRISAPEFNLTTFQFLLGPAITIAVLGAIESLLCAVVADDMIGTADKHDPNQELMAQGIANIVTPFFGGLPATGAIARTAANIRNGGHTPVAGLIHSVVCFLVLIVAAPLARAIPLAALSAILITVAINMGQWREFLRLSHYPKSDVFVLLVTFFLTVVFNLTVAVEVGMVSAAILFIKRMANQTNVVMMPMTHAVEEMDLDSPAQDVNNDILIIRIHGALFFGATQKLQTVMRYASQNPKVLIVKMKYVLSLDASSLVILRDLVSSAKRRKITVYFSGLSRQPLDVIKRSGLYKELGAKSFFEEHSQALEAAQNLLEAIKKQQMPVTEKNAGAAAEAGAVAMPVGPTDEATKEANTNDGAEKLVMLEEVATDQQTQMPETKDEMTQGEDNK